jgi:hypothetical protein
VADEDLDELSGNEDLEDVMPVDDGLVWVEKEVVRLLLERHCPDLLVQDRAPIWAVCVMDAGRACLAVLPMIDFGDMIARVRGQEGLRAAITGAYRMGAGAFDLVALIEDWRE